MNTRREGNGHEEDANKVIESFFFHKGPLCGGEIRRRNAFIHIFLIRRLMTEAKEMKEWIVKGLKKDPPLSVCADFRQTDNLVIETPEAKVH